MRAFIWVIVGLTFGLGSAQLDPIDDAPVADGVKVPESFVYLNQFETRLWKDAPYTLVYLPPTEVPPDDWEGYKHPFTVAGYVAPAPPDLLKQCRWSAFQHGDLSGRLGVLHLRSPNAKALRLRFTGKTWHPRAEIRVFDPQVEVAFGPLRPEWDEEGNWWTTIIFGDTIGIEIFLPDEVSPSELPELSAVAYHFRGWSPSDYDPASGCPLLDVTCYPDWADQRAAVCMVATISGGRVSGFCSGAALARNPADTAPYFSPVAMTARHCVSSSSTGVALVWNYHTATCNGTPPNPNTLPRNTGVTVLKTVANADWTILGTRDALFSSFYVGWSSSNAWALNAPATLISHPGGQYKRISFATRTGTSSCISASTWLVRLSEGSILGGSSGSPVFDDQRRVRGTATCATTCLLQNPKCCPPNSNALVLHGRLDIAFPVVRWYLFNPANPTYVNRAFAGDPSNDGSNEQGTSTNPFNTVYEGIVCVPAGGTVIIQPGNYNERLLFWRPMVLERGGTSGVVVIGAP